MPDHDADVDVVVRVAELGIDNVGHRYVDRGRSGRPSGDDEWIDYAVDHGWDGRGGALPVELRFQLILSAINAAGADDDQTLWLIADRPVDHLVGDDPSFARRFHAERSGNPTLSALFVVMQRSLLEERRAATWWDNDFETWFDEYWRTRQHSAGDT